MDLQNARTVPAARGAAAATETRAHIPVLDGLRGLAIVLVMIYHFTGGTDDAARGLDRWFSRLTGCGWCGVDLFFVLSGFLITGILCDTRRSPTYLRDFYARRALRIFPLYYGVLVVLFVVLPGILPAHMPGLQIVSEHQAWLWTYSSNIGIFFKGDSCFRSGLIQTGHFWSLAVEEQFYLAWPLTVLWLRRESLMRLCVVCIAVALASRCVLAASGYGGVYMFTPCRLDGLMCGAFLALAVRSERGVQALVPAARRIAAGCFAVLVIILLGAGLDELHWATRTVGYTLLAAMFGAVLVLVLAAPASSPCAKIFNHRILRFFGKYSYGLYVWHFLLTPAFGRFFSVNILVERVFGHYWPARFAYIVLSFAASIAIAWLSWHLYEKHFLRLKRYFEYRPGRRLGDTGSLPRGVLPAGLASGVRGASHS